MINGEDSLELVTRELKSLSKAILEKENESVVLIFFLGHPKTIQELPLSSAAEQLLIQFQQYQALKKNTVELVEGIVEEDLQRFLAERCEEVINSIQVLKKRTDDLLEEQPEEQRLDLYRFLIGCRRVEKLSVKETVENLKTEFKAAFPDRAFWVDAHPTTIKKDPLPQGQASPSIAVIIGQHRTNAMSTNYSMKKEPPVKQEIPIPTRRWSFSF